MELTELVKDYAATELLSKIELDFLETELWETIENIREVTSLSTAPNNVCVDLKLEEGSSWIMCCAVVLDAARPEHNSRVNKLDCLIKNYSLK